MSTKRRYYLPQNLKNREMYKEGWIDFNKNGVKDPFEDPSLPVEERVEDLLKRMTMTEKLEQLRCEIKISNSNVGNLAFATRGLTAKESAIKANEIEAKIIEQTRLGIPVIIHDECLHGCVAKFSTAFPQAIGLAATWDRELVYRVAKAIARETRTRGIHQCLSPVVNIARDVRAGRTEESYGEDPYLTSTMGAAYCRAMFEEGVIATPKHFAANFVGDGGRDSNEIHFSERILREIYFPGFRSCIKAGALSLMAAYNSLDGVPCSSNRWLLTEVLRNEWGFRGFVVSDYGSVIGIVYNHCVTASFEEAAKLALESGLEVELPIIYLFGDPLLKAVKEGLISEEVIDEAVRRVLRVKFLIGLFDRPFVDPDVAEETCNCGEHAQLALQAAREAIVLLKNDGKLLPLNRDRIKSIAVLGPLSNEAKLGGYSGFPRYVITPLEGIKRMVKPGTEVRHAKGCPSLWSYSKVDSRFLIPESGSKEHGLKGEYFDNPNLSGTPVFVRIDREIDFEWRGVSPDPRLPLENYSIRWTGKLVPPKTGTYEIGLATDDGVRFWLDGKLLIDFWYDRAENIDVVRVDLEEGKEYDVKIEYYQHAGNAAAHFYWDYGQSELLTEIGEAVKLAKDSDVAIICVGVIEGEGKDRCRLELPGLQERLIREVLKTGTPTIVVLFSGSAVTGDWINDVPAIIQAWYLGQEGGRALAEVFFGEYNPGGRLPFTWPRHAGQLPLYYNYKPTGRGYDYIDMPGTPLFPFGHGLSYTEFKYDNLQIKAVSDTGPFEISLKITNIGDREGDEVVQLYIQDVVASVARPVKELKDFRRIRLKAGESKTVTFTLMPDDLAFLDINMKRVVEPGEFRIMVGSSSSNIRLEGTMKVERRITAELKCVEVKPGKKVIKLGEPMELAVKLRNNGLITDVAHTQVLSSNVKLAEKRIELAPGEEQEVKMTVRLEKEGKQELVVGLPEPRERLTVLVKKKRKSKTRK